jgi:hypothetical protein
MLDRVLVARRSDVHALLARFGVPLLPSAPSIASAANADPAASRVVTR